METTETWLKTHGYHHWFKWRRIWSILRLILCSSPILAPKITFWWISLPSIIATVQSGRISCCTFKFEDVFMCSQYSKQYSMKNECLCFRKKALLLNNVWAFLGGIILFSARYVGESSYAMLTTLMIAGRLVVGINAGWSRKYYQNIEVVPY